jgi:hypothetical protein
MSGGVRTALLSALLLLACRETLAPWDEVDLSYAVKVEATADYVRWWNELEACSGLSRDIRSVQFYVIPNSDSVSVGSESYWGYWIRDGNKIVLAGNWATNEKLVKHEEMHALLQDGSQPTTYFNGLCGDLSYPNG